jgi:hypothetical protein
VVYAGTAALLALSGAPCAMADPLGTCTSSVVSGMEVDNCVGNPNADNSSNGPPVYVKLKGGLGLGGVGGGIGVGG